VRVALVTPRAVAGGAQILLARLLRPLDALGIQAHLVVGEQGPLAAWARSSAASVTVVPGLEASALDDVFDDVDPAVVWSEGATGHCRAGPLAAERSVPAVWWRSLTATGRPADDEAAAIPAVAIACLTRAACVDQRRRTPNVRVVRIGGALPHAAAVAAPRRRAQHERRVGIVGRIDPVKGIDTFLAAARDVARARRDVHFLVVGGAIVGHEGDLPTELRELAGQPGLDGRVTFTGHLEDPAPLVAGLDLLVSASREEAFGLSVLEAMAAGVPVVVTATDGPTELVDGGLGGLVVPIDDAPAMAAAIAACLRDPIAVAARVHHARRRSQAFTATATARRWAAVLRRAARVPSAARGGSTVRRMRRADGGAPVDQAPTRERPCA
jgi:glycosyltransferase involved in cell wall biosynthesis